MSQELYGLRLLGHSFTLEIVDLPFDVGAGIAVVSSRGSVIGQIGVGNHDRDGWTHKNLGSNFSVIHVASNRKNSRDPLSGKFFNRLVENLREFVGDCKNLAAIKNVLHADSVSRWG